jgi:chorismate mutase
MRLFGIRGATSVQANTGEEILRETEVLLKALVEANNLQQENVVSIIFTSTPDLTAEFPAKACRLMGWTGVPLLGAVEVDVPHGVPRCIRVLIHAYLEQGSKVKHVYLNEAQKLRPDLVDCSS